MKLKLFTPLFLTIFLLSCALSYPASIFETPEPTPNWDEATYNGPSTADEYYTRAFGLYEAAVPEGSLEIYLSRHEHALQDIDKAVSLRPDVGDYYGLRQLIYLGLAAAEKYSVDRQYVASIALDNAYKAYELGTTLEYPERQIILILIGTNQCQKALDEVQKLIDQSPEGDTSLGGLLHIRAQAYACLGKLDEALQSVNDSMFNNENMEYKKELEAQYLLMLGRYSEALPVLEELINGSDLNGHLLYMRTVAYYNLGMKDLVQGELNEGMSRSWERGGWLPYVEAQMALDNGKTEEAIGLLQYAEATFDPPHNPMRWKTQEQLHSLGAQPSTLIPSAQYRATPIP